MSSNATSALHSSKTVEWYTPPEYIEASRRVLDGIVLDPASCDEAQTIVKADKYLTREDDALSRSWIARSIFLNPPGGKVGNVSRAVCFWQKLVGTAEFDHAIFVAFSLEALQTTQKPEAPSIGEFPFCVPRERIRFYRPGWIKGGAPAHSNVIAYVPRSVDRTDVFVREFSKFGLVVQPSGEVAK